MDAGSGYPRRVFREANGRGVSFTMDGKPLEAFEGETLLAALMAERGWTLRRTECENAARGMFCGMGVCMDCLVHLEGEGLVRACFVFVREGMACRTPIPADGVGYPIE
ncbi:MAG: (2Fe-2S)-binding protein [Nitrospinota bacterium]|nr:(2Fe-2S)-binding protein [Nitrospinota bacterium]